MKDLIQPNEAVVHFWAERGVFILKVRTRHRFLCFTWSTWERKRHKNTHYQGYSWESQYPITSYSTKQDAIRDAESIGLKVLNK